MPLSDGRLLSSNLRHYFPVLFDGTTDAASHILLYIVYTNDSFLDEHVLILRFGFTLTGAAKHWYLNSHFSTLKDVFRAFMTRFDPQDDMVLDGFLKSLK